MDWNTVVVFWLVVTVFTTLCSMRWKHCTDKRFYVYLPLEMLIQLFWPLTVAHMFWHYKRTVPTTLYPVRQ